MAFGVQRWGSIFHSKENNDSQRHTKCDSASHNDKKNPNTPRRTGTRRLAAGKSLRDLRDAWSPKNNREPSHIVNDPKSNVAIDFILSPDVQRAISQSRYPSHVLPDVRHHSDLLMDLDFLTLDDTNDHAPPQYSPRAHNSPRYSPPREFARYGSRSPSIETGRVMIITSPSSSRSNSYTRAVQEWDKLHQRQQYAASQDESIPAPLRVRKNSADSLNDSGVFCSSPAHCTPLYEPDAFPFRDSIHVGIDYTCQSLSSGKRRPARQSQGHELRRVKRIRLEQPLPHLPSFTTAATDDVSCRHKADSGVGSDFGAKDDDLFQRNISSSSVNSFDYMMDVDRANFAPNANTMSTSSPTYETIVRETVAPAAIHETIIEDTHEIKHEVTTREIHNHHVYHRVLPILDIEILPARHFIRDESDPVILHEIAASALPPGSSEKAHLAIAQALSQILPAPLPAHQVSHPRRFTARDFPGTDGDYREYTTPDGVLHTERWWVHPPTLDDTAQAAGKTQAFHFDAPDGLPDGFREGTTAQDSVITTAPAIPEKSPRRYQNGPTANIAAAAAAAAVRIHAPGSEAAVADSLSSSSKRKSLPLKILDEITDRLADLDKISHRLG